MGLGDEIMATAWARRAKERNPDGQIFIGNGKIAEWSEVWENNPNINHPDEYRTAKRSIWVPHYTGFRPYIKGVTETNIVYEEDHVAEPGDIFLTDAEIAAAREKVGSGFILIEPHIKGSFSGNKAWIWDRWQGVLDGLVGTHRVVQIGARNKRPLAKVERVHTGSFRQALAILSQASLLITTDGALHHAAAALSVPAVVLWGARTHPKILGYEAHENLYTGQGESCGSMAPCAHCVQAMKRITVDMVLDAARKALREKGKDVVAA